MKIDLNADLGLPPRVQALLAFLHAALEHLLHSHPH